MKGVSAPTKQQQVSPQLINAVERLVKSTIGSTKASFEEKRRVLELALKLEAIKLKVDPRQFGSAFFDDDEVPPSGED